MITRSILVFCVAIIAGAMGDALLGPTPAAAVSREIIELQQSVAQLITRQQLMQTSVTQNYAVERTLIEESLEAVKHLNADVAVLQKIAGDSSVDAETRLDAIGAAVQGISNNVTDFNQDLSKLDNKLADIQSILQGKDSKPSPVVH